MKRFRRPDIRLGDRFGALKKSAGVWIGRGDGIVATDCNLVNVGTVVFVVVTRGPVLEGIERDSVNHIPCTVRGYNIKKGLKAVGLSNRRADARVAVERKYGTTWAAGAVELGAY